MIQIQMSKTDEDIFNKIMFLLPINYEYNIKDFMIVDKGDGACIYLYNESLSEIITQENIRNVSKKDADTKIKKTYTLEDIIKRLEVLEKNQSNK